MTQIKISTASLILLAISVVVTFMAIARNDPRPMGLGFFLLMLAYAVK
jgi:hypothetical protein